MDQEYEKNYWITEAMIKFGGSFVNSLGKLWRLGDPSNRKKLQFAFPVYWERYSVIARRQKLKEKAGK